MDTMDNFSTSPSLWKGLDLGFAIASLLLIFFFCYIELRQLKYGILDYFKSVWNCIDVCSLSINIIFIICDFSNVSTPIMRPLGSTCVLLLWIKLFYFMRLFNPTAKFIRMIM
jgi:hypothetical protein